MSVSEETKAKADAMQDLYHETCAERDALMVKLSETEKRAVAAENMVEHQNNVITALEIRLDGATIPVKYQHECPEGLETVMVPRELVEAAPGEKIIIKIAPTVTGLSDVDAVAAGELPPDYLGEE